MEGRNDAATTEDILKKLNEIYGNVKTADRVVHDFHSAKQKEGKPCLTWGERVETLFQQAEEKSKINENKRDRTLKDILSRGIRSDKLRMATRVYYESSDTCECLRMKA
ncbi:hypothetical protein DPMN_146582 [Dreissena polymorpha]|uniref:Paraneoplastic antigen Ma-like C-terminal domain-containing protein n=1 Tax=Dreissena polymorpha TaxID=45954 RepID=A0A9D4F7B4_DREPO|nr:hypothetical protein DPMN_146582 [Dreissena polymorpha]